jgi:hypothetical protein
MSDNSSCLPRELHHHRTHTRVQVSPLCSPANGRTWVAVCHARTDAGFALPALAGERARDPLDHPYARAARHGVPTTARRVVAAREQGER